MNDVDRRGLASIAEEAIALGGKGTGTGLHVSFDLDAGDPAIAPDIGTPVKGDLIYREAHMLTELVAESEKLSAIDLVEVNPILDSQNFDGPAGGGVGHLSFRQDHSLDGDDSPARTSWRVLVLYCQPQSANESVNTSRHRSYP